MAEFVPFVLTPCPVERHPSEPTVSESNPYHYRDAPDDSLEETRRAAERAFGEPASGIDPPNSPRQMLIKLGVLVFVISGLIIGLAVSFCGFVMWAF